MFNHDEKPVPSSAGSLRSTRSTHGMPNPSLAASAAGPGVVMIGGIPIAGVKGPGVSEEEVVDMPDQKATTSDLRAIMPPTSAATVIKTFTLVEQGVHDYSTGDHHPFGALIPLGPGYIEFEQPLDEDNNVYVSWRSDRFIIADLLVEDERQTHTLLQASAQPQRGRRGTFVPRTKIFTHRTEDKMLQVTLTHEEEIVSEEFQRQLLMVDTIKEIDMTSQKVDQALYLMRKRQIPASTETREDHMWYLVVLTLLLIVSQVATTRHDLKTAHWSFFLTCIGIVCVLLFSSANYCGFKLAERRDEQGFCAMLLYRACHLLLHLLLIAITVLIAVAWLLHK